MHIEVSREVAAPAERLWEVLIDLEHAPMTLSEIESIEILDGSGHLEQGARWRETRQLLGREVTELMKVTSFDPPHQLSVTAAAPGATYDSSYTVTPIDDESCRIDLAFVGRNTSFLPKLMSSTVGMLMWPAMRFTLAQDLRDLAQAAEARSAAGSRS